MTGVGQWGSHVVGATQEPPRACRSCCCLPALSLKHRIPFVHRHSFRRTIERPIKNREPLGLKRLQVGGAAVGGDWCMRAALQVAVVLCAMLLGTA